ncbi:MAG: ComF family protein [Clostridiales bacterium]|jgi:ComF family protein|nr:ComF family protein [Clostridiales bacterium]
MNISAGSIADFILGLIYPPKCMVCKNVKYGLDKTLICKDCFNYLDFIGEEALQAGELAIQYDNNQYLNGIFFVFWYDEIISSLIKQSKYNNHPVYNKGFAHFMADYYNKYIKLDIDFIAPVPIHKNKLKSRGFNQAAVLGSEFSKIMNIPFISDLIIRSQDTKPQSGLSKLSRRNNVEGAFTFNKKYLVNYKKVLIIDDIYTTGSTLNSCAKVLTDNGAIGVYGFCFSKTSQKK